jgi:hypothetical protein
MQESKTKLYKRYGVLLNHILDALNLERKHKNDLHKTLKDARGIESLRDLTKRELYEYILEIEVHFATEYGLELMSDPDETLSDDLKKNEDEL